MNQFTFQKQTIEEKKEKEKKEGRKERILHTSNRVNSPDLSSSRPIDC